MMINWEFRVDLFQLTSFVTLIKRKNFIRIPCILSVSIQLMLSFIRRILALCHLFFHTRSDSCHRPPYLNLKILVETGANK